MTYFRKKNFGPFLQDDEIFRGISSKVTGAKKFFQCFDKVPRRRLLAKLEAKGIKGKLKNWLGEWLSERTQRVVIDGEASSESAVESGIPQGTVMGPPLFDVELVVILADLLTIFADDTEGLKEITCKNGRIELQTVLNNLCEWAKNGACLLI
jgi:Reverse transcriptase (RNA-dependent DNA polymerase)